MRRQIQGLSSSAAGQEIPDGVYLVKVQKAHYRWHKLKPFYELHFFVLQPETFVGASIVARLFCSPKTLWKFAWFLRDFRYSQELLDRDEIDPRALIGLQGVLQISNEVVNGRAVVNLNAFAPAADWEHLANQSRNPEVA
jgi:hypothetical protein